MRLTVAVNCAQPAHGLEALNVRPMFLSATYFTGQN
jgi:hypothetical protein